MSEQYVIDVPDSAAFIMEDACSRYAEGRSILNIGMVEQCILSHCEQHEDGRIIITDEGLCSAIENVDHLIIQGILTRMASEGLIECAWDSDLNEFVYWKKE